MTLNQWQNNYRQRRRVAYNLSCIIGEKQLKTAADMTISKNDPFIGGAAAGKDGNDGEMDCGAITDGVPRLFALSFVSPSEREWQRWLI
jgi:hypothetical protein